MEKEKIDVKTTLQYKDAVSYLEDLTRSFKSGTIVIESGENSLIMKPGEQVSIKVEAFIFFSTTILRPTFAHFQRAIPHIPVAMHLLKL